MERLVSQRPTHYFINRNDTGFNVGSQDLPFPIWFLSHSLLMLTLQDSLGLLGSWLKRS